MINFFKCDAEPLDQLWIGIGGFTYNSVRRSPSREKRVREKGWYLEFYLFGKKYVIHWEKLYED